MDVNRVFNCFYDVQTSRVSTSASLAKCLSVAESVTGAGSSGVSSAVKN